MFDINILEFLLVGAIIIIQIGTARATQKKIKVLGTIIPPLNAFKIRVYHIPLEEIKKLEPAEILNDLSFYEVPDEGDLSAADQNKVSLIIRQSPVHEIFDNILHYINVYLLRNKGAASDFNLIKDVVERNLDIEIDELDRTVTTPLYLGLIGTMVGIVFGLVNLFLITGTEELSIKTFLKGVAIAMFASFCGLTCTVVNSNYNLKASRRALEKAKNLFYTFIQTELLPVLNQSVSSTMYSLFDNLALFNQHFTGNLDRLEVLMNKNHDALLAQEFILDSLRDINIVEFAKANVLVLTELKSSVVQLEKFNQYLNSLNYLVNGTTLLTHSFEELLKGTNNFKGLAEKLDSRVEQSNLLYQFFNDHFQQFDDRKDLMRDAVVRTDDLLTRSLEELSTHTHEKMESFRQLILKEEDLIVQAFTGKEDYLSKLSKLAVLDELKDQLSNLTTITQNAAREKINVKVDNEQPILKDILLQLQKMNEQMEDSRAAGGIFHFPRWFKRRNNRREVN